MSDKTRDILAGINTRLTTLTAAGQALEDIKSFFVKYTSTDEPPDHLAHPPLLTVEALAVIPVRRSIPPCMYWKLTPILFTLYQENAGDTTRTGSAVLIDTIEDEFFQQKFGISNLLVDVAAKDYSVPQGAPFGWPFHSGGHLTITYGYTDTRAIP